MTWGVIAFKIRGSEIQVVGSASGPVVCEQTVFRAEAQALVYLVGKVQGQLEVTTDALSVTKAVRRRPGWKSEDLLQPLREANERLHLTWVNSHLTQQELLSWACPAALFVVIVWVGGGGVLVSWKVVSSSRIKKERLEVTGFQFAPFEDFGQCLKS